MTPWFWSFSPLSPYCLPKAVIPSAAGKGSCSVCYIWSSFSLSSSDRRTIKTATTFLWKMMAVLTFIFIQLIFLLLFLFFLFLYKQLSDIYYYVSCFSTTLLIINYHLHKWYSIILKVSIDFLSSYKLWSLGTCSLQQILSIWVSL